MTIEIYGIAADGLSRRRKRAFAETVIGVLSQYVDDEQMQRAVHIGIQGLLEDERRIDADPCR